jgi:adenine/guanine phosphoribosyltransferase-like PRPP-binding protein
MLEIDIRNYNEMLRYEKDMDALRTLVFKVLQPGNNLEVRGYKSAKEYILTLIKFYTRQFAEDIYDRGSIQKETISRFHSGLYTTNQLLGITETDVKKASAMQLYHNSGFWEMRRYLGQFKDLAEDLKKDKINQIVCIGISGCVVGEYVGLVLEKIGEEIPVDHMIMERDSDAMPTVGHLSDAFTLSGNKVLIVDDALLEARTLPVAIRSLEKFDHNIRPDLFVVDIEPLVDLSHLPYQPKIYLFEE